MPGVLSKHAQLSAEDEAEYVGDGDIAKDTQKERMFIIKECLLLG